jgi:hypothetical protein
MGSDGAIVDLGAGVINFFEILKASKLTNIRHYFVEQDYSLDPVASIKADFDFLRALKA